MKKFILFTCFYLFIVNLCGGQITTPVIRAAFGVDGDLRSHYFNGFVQTGNDDWFNLRTAVLDTGRFVIDTNGAAAQVALYTTNLPSRRLPFYRNMRYPQFSVVNNRLLLDAVMIRDYHGDDSTVFASGSNKNGDSPENWSCPVSQGIPDKNDILDMFVHVRRAGPNSTDSLWMFGGLSLDNTTGNRYFDFEMYQTDIYYDRTTRQFYGYGPDMGHTTWQFDAFGNVTVPGDIIFSASYQSSSLTFLEARIWVHQSALSTVPADFNWSGQFDGAYSGAPYGYASILPKTVGAYYTGLQCVNNTWGGPFGIILQNDALVTNYTAGQFVEFSVNLTKLGLDPVTLLGGNTCGMPFRRILVKTRASASFTAELKDFVGPFDLFLPARVELETETPYICDSGSVSQISVIDPVPSQLYQWSTLNGNIVGSTTGPSIFVDTPGIYIVHQYLQAGCSEYASDTIEIFSFGHCEVLSGNLYDFTAKLQTGAVRLDWKVLYNHIVDYFDVERSFDGINFSPAGRVEAYNGVRDQASYDFTDIIAENWKQAVFYRIRMKETGKMTRYSQVIKIPLKSSSLNDVMILPNPAFDIVQLKVQSLRAGEVKVRIVNAEGKLVYNRHHSVRSGMNVIIINELQMAPRGVYTAMITIGEEIFNQKLILVR